MGKRLADWAKENNISSAWAHKLYHAGKVRIEGKEYVMSDGDVVEFRSGLTSGGKK